MGTVIASTATMETLWKKDLASICFGWLCRYHWIERACEFHPNVFIETSRLGETSGEEIKERNITIFGIFTASSESNAHGISAIRRMLWVQCKLRSTDRINDNVHYHSKKKKIK